MNTIIRTVFLFGFSTLFAQDFQGIATYKTKDKIDIELDSTQVLFHDLWIRLFL